MRKGSNKQQFPDTSGDDKPLLIVNKSINGLTGLDAVPSEYFSILSKFIWLYRRTVAVNAEMFVGVCLTGGALLLGIVGAQFFNSRKAASKTTNFDRRVD